MDTADLHKLDCELKKNQQDVYIMTPDEFEDLKCKLQPKTRLDHLKTIGGYVSPFKDAGTALQQMKETGFWGKVHEKTIEGKRYVIFNGSKTLRNNLRGTRYLANNPKVVALAIGRTGYRNSIISGAKLTFYLTAPISVIQALTSDEPTLGSIVGKVAADLIKVGIASTIAMLAASFVGAMTCVAAGPLIVAIVLGVAVSSKLNEFDKQFQLTEKLVHYIDDISASILEKTFGRLASEFVKAEHILNWQAKHGKLVGKGVFF